MAFKPGFTGGINQKEYECKMRQSDLQTSQHWRQTYSQKWAQSRFGSGNNGWIVSAS